MSLPKALPQAGPVAETFRISAIATDRSADCARVHAASFDAAWDAADFERFLNAAGTLAHGVVDGTDDHLVAIVLSRLAVDEAEVLTLAVAPAHRRRGLGHRLLAAHLAGLAEAGAGCLFLEVDAGNAPARALYASFGFAVVGERQGYYRSARQSPAAALVLRRDLARDGRFRIHRK